MISQMKVNIYNSEYSNESFPCILFKFKKDFPLREGFQKKNLVKYLQYSSKFSDINNYISLKCNKKI